MKCPKCGKQLEHGKTFDGKEVYLDPIPPVYIVLEDNRSVVDMNIKRLPNAHVDHKFTCLSQSS